MALVKLKRTDTKPGSGPHIRIYPSGQIAINAAAYRALGQGEHVEIYVEDGKEVRFTPVPEATQDSYKIVGFKAGGATLSAIVLVRRLIPELAEPIRLPATIVGDSLAARVEDAA